MSPFFCVSCHKPAPYLATEEFFYGLFWLCNDCVFKFGTPPGAIEVNPAVASLARQVPQLAVEVR